MIKGMCGQWACNLASLVLRLVVGGIFIVHGHSKVFVNGTDAVALKFTEMGIFMPEITAPLVAYTEFVGGILLVIGLLTPIAAFMIACTMAVAVFKVHFASGLTGPGGYEYPLSLLASSRASS